MSFFSNGNYVDDLLNGIFLDLQNNKHNSNVANTYFALMSLKEHFINGNTNVDITGIVELLKQPASNHYPPAQFLLGVAYLEGLSGFGKSKQGLELIKTAAYNLYAPAYCLLGGISMRGDKNLGVEQSLHEAFIYFNASAELMDKNGLRNAAMCYMYGIGVRPNSLLGIDLLCKSAQVGNPQALLDLTWFAKQYVVMTSRIPQAQTPYELQQRGVATSNTTTLQYKDGPHVEAVENSPPMPPLTLGKSMMPYSSTGQGRSTSCSGSEKNSLSSSVTATALSTVPNTPSDTPRLTSLGRP